MAEQFYTILTAIGKAKIANAAVLGKKIELTELALGDGGGSYYNPTEDQTELRNEVWRGAIGKVDIDGENPNWIIIQTVVPSQHGGFMIREAGVFDNEGDLIAVGKYPETYKPALADGSIKDLVVRMILEVSNTASVVLKVDSTVFATQQQVNEAEARAKAYTDQEVAEVSQALAAHKAAAAPHSGHETPAGAQAKADIAEQNAKAYADIVANTAETNAKNYADAKIDDLAGEGRTTETVKEVADDLASHKANTANPHNVTKSQIGLGNVDNVKQASKTEFDSHNNDTTRHITAEERTRWNNKAEVSQIPTKVSQLENDRGYVTQEELDNAGYGDMRKAVYDTNNDGKVDVAETVIGKEIQLGSYKLIYNSTTNSLDIEVIS